MTYHEFWLCVLGQRTADGVIEKFELDPTDREGMAEWMDDSIIVAFGIDSDYPSDYGDRMLDELCSASEE